MFACARGLPAANVSNEPPPPLIEQELGPAATLVEPRVAMRRPDRLAGDASGDARNGSFWYDGQTFTAIDHEQNVWASGTVPPTVDGALDWVFGQTGTAVPLGDFLYANPYERLMSDVQRGVYLGIHDVAGVPCHHLSFEQAAISFGWSY